MAALLWGKEAENMLRGLSKHSEVKMEAAMS